MMAEEEENVRRSGRQRVASKRFQDMVMEPAVKRKAQANAGRKTVESSVMTPPSKRSRSQPAVRQPQKKDVIKSRKQNTDEALAPVSLTSALKIAEDEFHNEEVTPPVTALNSVRDHGAPKGEASQQAGSECIMKQTPQAGSECIMKQTPQAGSECIMKQSSQAGSERIMKQSSQAGSEHIMKQSSQAGSECIMKQSSQAGNERITKQTPQTGSECVTKLTQQASSEQMMKQSSQAGCERIVKQSPQAGSEQIMRQSSQADSKHSTEQSLQAGSECIIERSNTVDENPDAAADDAGREDVVVIQTGGGGEHPLHIESVTSLSEVDFTNNTSKSFEADKMDEGHSAKVTWSSAENVEAVTLTDVTETVENGMSQVSENKQEENVSHANLLQVTYNDAGKTERGDGVKVKAESENTAEDGAGSVADGGVDAVKVTAAIGSSESLMNTRLEIASSLQEASATIHNSENSLVLSLGELSQNNVVMDSCGQFIIMDWNSSAAISGSCDAGGSTSGEQEVYGSLLSEPLLPGDTSVTSVKTEYSDHNAVSSVTNEYPDNPLRSVANEYAGNATVSSAGAAYSGGSTASCVVSEYSSDGATVCNTPTMPVVAASLATSSSNTATTLISANKTSLHGNVPQCISLVNVKKPSADIVRVGSSRQTSAGLSLLGTPSNCVSLLKKPSHTAAPTSTISASAPEHAPVVVRQSVSMPTAPADASQESLTAVDVTSCFASPQTALTALSMSTSPAVQPPTNPSSQVQQNATAISIPACHDSMQTVATPVVTSDTTSNSSVTVLTSAVAADLTSSPSEGISVQAPLTFAELKTLTSGKRPVSIKFITLNQPPAAPEPVKDGEVPTTSVVTVEGVAQKPAAEGSAATSEARKCGDVEMVLQGPVLVDGVYNCIYCSYQTEKRTNWYKHKRTHMGQRIYQCDECEYQATTTSNLKRHRLTHTNWKEFQCTQCGVEFRQKIHLERHIKYKHEEKRIKCEFCDYVCANINPDLKIHLRRKHLLQSNAPEAATRLVCQKCTFIAASRRDLAQHMKFHRKGPELKLYCEMCSFVTDCESRLKRHLRTHTNEKPYACDYCEYRASQREHIVRHMDKKHNIVIPKAQPKNVKDDTSDGQDKDSAETVEQKPPRKKYPPADFSRKDKVFACTHCTMKFAKLLNLYKHLQVQHPEVSLVRPDGMLFCIACDYQSLKKQNLLVHMRKHSNAADPQSVRDRPHYYTCMICNYSSPRRKNLYTHMRRKHHMQIVIKEDGTTCCYLDDVDGSVVIDEDNAMAADSSSLGPTNGLISTSQNILNASSEPPRVVMLEMEPGGHLETVKIEPTGRSPNDANVEAEIAIEGLSALAAQVPENAEPVKDVETAAGDEKQNIEVSEEQLMQISAGDFIEINGEMYKVEFTST